jgi:hypothetical protein
VQSVFRNSTWTAIKRGREGNDAIDVISHLKSKHRRRWICLRLRISETLRLRDYMSFFHYSSIAFKTHTVQVRRIFGNISGANMLKNRNLRGGNVLGNLRPIHLWAGMIRNPWFWLLCDFAHINYYRKLVFLRAYNIQTKIQKGRYTITAKLFKQRCMTSSWFTSQTN